MGACTSTAANATLHRYLIGRGKSPALTHAYHHGHDSHDHDSHEHLERIS